MKQAKLLRFHCKLLKFSTQNASEKRQRQLTSTSSSDAFPLSCECSLMKANPFIIGDKVSSSLSSTGDLLLVDVAADNARVNAARMRAKQKWKAGVVKGQAMLSSSSSKSMDFRTSPTVKVCSWKSKWVGVINNLKTVGARIPNQFKVRTFWKSIFER